MMALSDPINGLECKCKHATAGDDAVLLLKVANDGRMATAYIRAA